MGLYPPVVAMPLCPSPSQSAVSQYGWGSTPCGAVSTRVVIVIVPAFLELYRFGGFMNGGWDPIFPVCDGNASHRWASIHLGQRCGARNYRRLANGIGVFSPCGAVSTRESWVFFPGWLMEFWRYGTTSGPGMGPYPPEVELAQHTNPNPSEIGRWGWDFHTMRGGVNLDDVRVRPRVVGVVDVWMDSDPGSDPIVPG